MGLKSIEIMPPQATVVFEVSPQNRGTATFRALGHFADGRMRDITDQVKWVLGTTVDPIAVVTLPGAVTATGNHGGETDVAAQTDQVQASAKLTVLLRASHLAAGAPGDAPTRFAGPLLPSFVPTVLYPNDSTLLPPNLRAFEFQWQPAAGTNLFDLHIFSAYLDMHVYTPDSRYLPSDDEWRWIAQSSRGGQVRYELAAIEDSGAHGIGRAAERRLSVAATDVQGALYYWAAPSQGSGDIWRYDFGGFTSAQRFYGTSDFPQGAAVVCVGCHTLSKDGTKMGVAFGINVAHTHHTAFVDVNDKKPYIGVNPVVDASFSTYSPDAKLIVSSFLGALTLRDGTTGATLGTVPTSPGRAATPTWSPDGTKLAYVSYPSLDEDDWAFSSGSIEVIEFKGGVWGMPKRLVGAQDGENFYYPDFSPDGQWLLFNRAPQGLSKSNPQGELFVIRADGSGEKIRLDRANGGNPAPGNSWARWSPFVQTLGSRPLYWITVSSVRPYGNDLPARSNNPQLWMFGFQPPEENASDPSWPAFWLPFQSKATGNHSAQWTTQLVQ